MENVYSATFERINEVYQLFNDRESKDVFFQRLYADCGSDQRIMSQIIKRSSNINKYKQMIQDFFKEFIMLYQDDIENIILFGAGEYGSKLLWLLDLIDVRLLTVCDQFRTGKIESRDIISFDNIKNISEKKIVIGVQKWHYKNVIAFLKENGVLDENIIFLPDIFDLFFKSIPSQYFDKNIISFYENEVFVDAGCYHGETALQFFNITKGRYKKIIAFEPDDKNLNILKTSTRKIDNFKVVNAALYREKTTLNFTYNGGASKIDDNGNISVNAIDLDSVVGDEQVTFIKMDIDGGEIDALIGAKETIQRCLPKLAISVYHKGGDVIEIPLFIYKLSNDYSFYLRHYTLGMTETVLYAIPGCKK